MIDVVGYLNTGLSVQPEQAREASDEMGKDSFMELLVAQMTNQNPLEPMENTEFIAQLAQFSSLEQMQNIASGVEMLALTQTAATNSQMVNLIGKRVIVPGSSLSIDSENQNPVELRFSVDSETDTPPTHIMIKDQDGDVVRTLEITDFNAGMNEIMFDGKDKDGNLLDAGNYTYKLVDSSSMPVEGVSTYSNFVVDSVAYQGSNILLKSDGTTIDLGDVSEVIRN